MKHCYAVILTALLFPVISFAQNNFKTGYVVTVKGDTIKGYVDYQEWDNNPSAIRFKSIDNKIQSFTTNNIKFFSIDYLEAYQKYSGPISNDETNDNRILRGRDTSFVTKDVFMKVLQTGKIINLYGYSDAIKPRFFYNDPTVDDAVHELVYHIYYNGNTGNVVKGSTTVEKTYLTQLTTVALKAKVLTDDVQKVMNGAEYTAPDLLKIVSKMNGLTKKQSKNSQPDNKNNNGNFDTYVGLGLTSATTTPTGNYVGAGGSAYTSFLPKGLVGFSAYVNPNTRRLVFSVELGVTQINFRDVYNSKVAPYQSGIIYKFNQIVISLVPQVTYNFYNADNFKIYGAFGLDLSRYSFYNKHFERQDGTPAFTDLFPFAFSKWGNSALFKVGVLVHKRFQVYADKISDNSISYDPFFGFVQSYYHVGINYFLDKQK